MGPPKNADQLETNELEQKGMEKAKQWWTYGTAYAQEHGTRTATIGECSIPCKMDLNSMS